MRERTVLVVEDEADIARIIGLSLKLIGHWNVETCQSASDIAKAVSHNRPDLILLDRMLAGSDGIEVCKRLKRDQALADIPVIFLSAKCAESDREEGLAAGAAGYLGKPFDPMELADEIRAVLGET